MLNKHIIIIFIITCCITVSCTVEKSIVSEINRTQKKQHDKVDIVYNKHVRKLYYKYVNQFRDKIISDFIRESDCLDTFYLLEIKKDQQFYVKGYIWGKNVYYSYEISDFEKKEMIVNQIDRDVLIEQLFDDYIQRVESDNFLDKKNSSRLRTIGGPVIILIRIITNKGKVEVGVEQFWDYE